MSIGLSEIIVIALVAIIIIRPERLPEYIRNCKKVLSDIRETSDKVSNDVKSTVDNLISEDNNSEKQ